MKLITGSGVEHVVFEICVDRGTFAAPLTVYSTAADVDAAACRMSQMLPGQEVRVETMARIKATYLDGKRVVVRDYREFYSNLTDEEYRATQFRCFTTAELI
jgi:hypothetical protein